MRILAALVGVTIVALVSVDQLATILATGRGSGSLVPRLTSRVWRVALALHRRRPSHRRLSVVGVMLLVAAPGVWAAGLWLGWTLIFLGGEGAVVEAESGEPASTLVRAYFAGFSLFTLGLGDVRPGGDWWRILTVLASFMGLAMITLGISYLVPVVNAATERRQLSRVLRQLGDRPDDLLRSDPAPRQLVLEELVSARTLMAKVTEQHLTHHVLRYYHSAEASLSLAIRVATVWVAVQRWRALEEAQDPEAAARLDLVSGALGELACAMVEADPANTGQELIIELLHADGHAEVAAELGLVAGEPSGSAPAGNEV